MEEILKRTNDLRFTLIDPINNSFSTYILNRGIGDIWISVTSNAPEMEANHAGFKSCILEIHPEAEFEEYYEFNQSVF